MAVAAAKKVSAAAMSEANRIGVPMVACPSKAACPLLSTGRSWALSVSLVDPVCRMGKWQRPE